MYRYVLMHMSKCIQSPIYTKYIYIHIVWCLSMFASRGTLTLKDCGAHLVDTMFTDLCAELRMIAGHFRDLAVCADKKQVCLRKAMARPQHTKPYQTKPHQTIPTPLNHPQRHHTIHSKLYQTTPRQATPQCTLSRSVFSLYPYTYV